MSALQENDALKAKASEEIDRRVSEFKGVLRDLIRIPTDNPPGDTVAGVEYISAWRVFCNPEGCLTRVGPTANDVVTTDIVHLSNAGSQFLVEAIEGSLFRPN